MASNRWIMGVAAVMFFTGCTHFNVVSSGEIPDDPFIEPPGAAGGPFMLATQAKPVAKPEVVTAAPPPAPKPEPKPVAVTPVPEPAKKAVVETQPKAVSTAMQGKNDTQCSAEEQLAAYKRRYFQMGNQKTDHVRVSATGYGAPPKAYFPEPQRRLMAMRAAKVDAYRSLAERVNGLRVWGGTTVGDMVVEKDRYRVFLDSVVRGAEVMTVNGMEDGTYETIVEMTLGQAFLAQVLADEPCLPNGGHGGMAMQGASASMGRPANGGFYYDEQD